MILTCVFISESCPESQFVKHVNPWVVLSGFEVGRQVVRLVALDVVYFLVEAAESVISEIRDKYVLKISIEIQVKKLHIEVYCPL